MTGRVSSQSSDSSKAGTSKNALLSDTLKTGNISRSEDVHDKWSQSTVSFDFDKMHADDFPIFLNDEFSIHKNDEALLADFTALLEDGDDAMMTTAATVTKVPANQEKEKELNKIDANMSTSTSHSLNSSGGEILVTTDTRLSTEQHSQSIGSIMSDHDYLSREDILEIMHNDEEIFFSQGYPKPMKVENDSMDVNLSGNVPILMSQPHIESTDAMTENIENKTNSLPKDVAKSILAPLLVKLTSTEPGKKANLLETLSELEEKITKLKESLASESGSGDTSSGIGATTTSDDTNKSEKHAEPTISECDSDAIFSCDRSEPLEYYGDAKVLSTTTTDESGSYQFAYDFPFLSVNINFHYNSFSFSVYRRRIYVQIEIRTQYSGRIERRIAFDYQIFSTGYCAVVGTSHQYQICHSPGENVG